MRALSHVQNQSPARRARRVLGASAALLVALATMDAHAQKDVNPPLPNVLLLVDTSGSMEYKIDGTLPTTCVHTAGGGSDVNRWTSLVEVLSGAVQGRGCYQTDRDAAAFSTEYSLSGVPPYDASYHIPHHRIVSNDCVASPGALPATPFEWGAAIDYHQYDDNATVCGTAFAQDSDGLLDVFRDRVRFGFMSFDNRPNQMTGVTGGVASYAEGVQGMWSYFYNWQTSTTPFYCDGADGSLPALSGFCVGYPQAGCSVQIVPGKFGYAVEVGARNAAAPPWEGRMIGFGPWDGTLTQVQRQSDNIQEMLRTLRPYGATPLAGMLYDAYTYLFYDNDDEGDPYFVPTPKFGPEMSAGASANDQFVGGGCRETHVVVLSDGAPNLDLREDCLTMGGQCPYDRPWEIAKEIATDASARSKVLVHSVGFALEYGTGFDCRTLVPATAFDPGQPCENPTGPIAACCELLGIAVRGRPDPEDQGTAAFANTQAELKTELSKIFASVAAGTTSRTTPLFVSVVNTQPSGAPGVAYLITSSFDPNPGALWTGNIERQRYVCTGGVANLVDIDEDKGDDLRVNLNDGQGGAARTFYTVVGPDATLAGAAFTDSEGNLRPNLVAAEDDGLGLTAATTVSGTRGDMATAMSSNPEAMHMVPLPAACLAANLNETTPADCASTVIGWELGEANGALPSRVGAELGAIYHASPAAVGVPSAYVRDASYEAFADLNVERPLMLYAVSTDGQLHAFKIASNLSGDTTGILGDEKKNNELWSFLPPHVLPNILDQYPTTQQFLLDGAPVVKDVIFDRDLGGAQLGTATWRTVLVAGGGRAGGFYYALDVTDPTAPVFLWQLGHAFDDGADTFKPLFSSKSLTPAIAQIRIDEGSGAHEVAVAILPGGEGTLNGASCPRSQAGPYPQIVAGGFGAYEPRATTAGAQVRCWADGAARSLTIVRLSDGKVLRRFQRVAADGPDNAGFVARITLSNIDAPFTSPPIPFPAAAGDLANRVYIGDADGTLWRLNLSSPLPANWKLDMAFDAYNASLGFDDPLFTGHDDESHSQPIVVAPVVGIDGLGNTIISIATGEQETFHVYSAGMRTRLWSITEKPVLSGTGLGEKNFTIEPNWVIMYGNGARVTGPMDLFDEKLYFASFHPVTGDVCTDGTARVTSANFRERDTLDLDKGPLAKVIAYDSVVENEQGAVVFGVTITQEPSCFTSAGATDDYVGSYRQISAATPGSFKLSFHTGTKGTAAVGARTNIKSIGLNAYASGVRIDSWATVEE